MLELKNLYFKSVFKLFDSLELYSRFLWMPSMDSQLIRLQTHKQCVNYTISKFMGLTFLIFMDMFFWL